MIIYFLIQHAFLVVLMSCLIQYQYSAKKSFLIIAAANIVIWLLSYAIYLFMGMEFWNYIYPIAVGVPVYICFSIVSKSNQFKVLFSFLTVCNFGMLKSYVGSLALHFIHSFAISIVFETVCFAAILILILKVFRKPYFTILSTLDTGWGIFCCVPTILSIIIYGLLYYPLPNKTQPLYILLVFLVFFLLMVFYAIIFLNFKNISQFFQLKQQKEMLLLQTDLQKKAYYTLMDKINAAQIYRHDMRHHIHVISSFLNDGKIAEVQLYLSRLNENLDKTTIENYCQNYAVNVILSSYIHKAKQEKIKVTSQVCLTEEIKIDNMELGLIFANAIENALNACKKIEDPNGKEISIVCKEHYDQLYIQICNSYVGEIEFDGEYPVSHEEGHGIGTRSMAATAEKYGGIFSFTAQDGIFKTTVVLNYR